MTTIYLLRLSARALLWLGNRLHTAAHRLQSMAQSLALRQPLPPGGLALPEALREWTPPGR